MVATETQGSGGTGASASWQSFTLDPAGRIRNSAQGSGVTVGAAGTESKRTLNHYSDGSDSPSWIATSTDAGGSWSWEREVTGLDGSLAATQTASGAPELQLVNLHGDVAATMTDSTTATGVDSTSDDTEYGIPRTPSLSAASSTRYGWVGGKKRSSDDLGGLILTGARLYNPATGLFTSIDPVPGGNANPYTYPQIPSTDTTRRGALLSTSSLTLRAKATITK